MSNWVPNLNFWRFDFLLMALKNSNFIDDYLDLILPQFDEIPLILKKWYKLNKSMEFRCFVKNN